MFALLMVTNAILGRIFLGQRITDGFVIGSGIAIAGIALLFVQEYRLAPIDRSAVFIGIELTLVAIRCTPAANILQANEGAKAQPILTLTSGRDVYAGHGRSAGDRYAGRLSGGRSLSRHHRIGGDFPSISA